MAHAATPPPGRQRRNAIIGAGVVVVGVVLAVIAIIGLNHPKGAGQDADATRTRTITSGATAPSRSSSPGGSSSPSSRPSSSRPSSRPSSTRPPSSSSSRSSSAPPASGSSVPDIPLVILNNTGQSGLAATAQSRFESKGWKVASTGNYDNSDIISTCAYWDATVPGSEAAATLLQQQFPNIQRVKQRFDGLPSGGVVVVLNPDYS